MSNVLPCIVCGRKLNPVFNCQPSIGTTFISHGQYGSTVFDPMTGDYLEVNICDPCVLTAVENQKVFWYDRENERVRPGIEYYIKEQYDDLSQVWEWVNECIESRPFPEQNGD